MPSSNKSTQQHPIVFMDLQIEDVRMHMQIKQGVHASKFQQNDWRAGRKGGVGADVGIGANPDARDTAFTDIKVAASGDSSATTGPKAAAVSDTAASGGDKKVASENGSASKAPAATNGNHVTNGNSAPESGARAFYFSTLTECIIGRLW